MGFSMGQCQISERQGFCLYTYVLTGKGILLEHAASPMYKKKKGINRLPCNYSRRVFTYPFKAHAHQTNQGWENESIGHEGESKPVSDCSQYLLHPSCNRNHCVEVVVNPRVLMTPPKKSHATWGHLHIGTWSKAHATLFFFMQSNQENSHQAIAEDGGDLKN